MNGWGAEDDFEEYPPGASEDSSGDADTESSEEEAVALLDGMLFVEGLQRDLMAEINGATGASGARPFHDAFGDRPFAAAADAFSSGNDAGSADAAASAGGEDEGSPRGGLPEVPSVVAEFDFGGGGGGGEGDGSGDEGEGNGPEWVVEIGPEGELVGLPLGIGQFAEGRGIHTAAAAAEQRAERRRSGKRRRQRSAHIPVRGAPRLLDRYPDNLVYRGGPVAGLQVGPLGAGVAGFEAGKVL